MKTCAKCQTTFPTSLRMDGKKKNLQRRKYCLTCSPFGSHNTSQIHLPKKQGSGRDYSEMTDEQKKIHSKKSYDISKKRGIERKIKLIEILGGSCESCGYKKNLGALEFHHVIPEEKKFKLDVRTLTNKKWDFILEELKKCKLLCANCHAEKHYPHLENWGHLDSNQDPHDYEPFAPPLSYTP